MPTLTDHERIRAWAQERDAHPAIVEGTESAKGEGVLRFDFGDPNDNLRRIDWDEFFQIFDEHGLTLLYDEDAESRFHKFVYPEHAHRA